MKVDISDAKISMDPEETLVTYALGSCIGVCFYDPVRRIGAMLHCLLPDSARDALHATENPFMFADTGLALLLERLLSLGANKRRLQVTVAGGARRSANTVRHLDIGNQNYLAIRKALWRGGLLIRAEDVGGTTPRTMLLKIADGSVTLQSQGRRWEL